VGGGGTDADLATLRGWLTGSDVPPGLAIDTDLRWTVLQALIANGRAEATEIEAELDRDRTASGERAAAQAHAMVPTAAAKEETWRQLTGQEVLANSTQRAMLLGFYHPAQGELTARQVSKFFSGGDTTWARRA